jgi:TonB family protein
MKIRIWPAILIVLAPLGAFSVSTPAAAPQASALGQRELNFFGSLTRAAQFADVRHVSSRPDCAAVNPPTALATPDPLMASPSNGSKVAISFIIGTDGRVHSPLILESAGTAGDAHVLRTVRTWRYRPATCDGIPTETEGKVEFSSR